MTIKPKFDRLAVSRVHGITIVNPSKLTLHSWGDIGSLVAPKGFALVACAFHFSYIVRVLPR